MTIPSGGATVQALGTLSGDTNSNVATNTYTLSGGSSTGVVYYYIEDMLGSSRTIVQDGATAPCYDADFYPFGGERVIANACPQNYKFEGKERDAETGNDDFGARYYSSRFGRWLSADWSAVPAPVPYANLTNPQTLNLYAMVSDNPETFADLDGHGQANEGSNTNTGCNYTSNKCDDDKSNHDQNADKDKENDEKKKKDDEKSCDQACHEKRAAWAKLIADSALVAATLAGGEGEAAAEELEIEAAQLQAEADATGETVTEGSVGGTGAGQKFSNADRAEDAGKPCAYCGKETTEKPGHPNSRETDHIHPRSRNGNNTGANRAPACRTCNRSKGARTPSEWLGADWRHISYDVIIYGISIWKTSGA